jgi:hypothetical protein
MVKTLTLAVSLCCSAALAAQPAPCLRLNTPWWQLGATRFFQSSGAAPQLNAFGAERHYIDRRVLQRDAGGYRMEITRTQLGLRDSEVRASVRFDARGALVQVTGDTGAVSHDVAPLVVHPCASLAAGQAFPDLAQRVDTVRLLIQNSITRVTATVPVKVGPPIDTLGARLAMIFAQRAVTDSSRGQMGRRLAGQRTDTITLWSALTGEEKERQLIRTSDGQVVFRERLRRLRGRGSVPPHPLTDTVDMRVEAATIERLSDSSAAARALAFPRRGEPQYSTNSRDTVAVHYKEWRGDTLVLRQIRRSGWRDELRTVWRESQLMSAELTEPGTVLQDAGPTRSVMRVTSGYLHTGGFGDSSVAIPSHTWAVALDGFEDAIIPALLGVPADSQPHRVSLYAIVNGRGQWLHWSVTILNRGAVRVARFVTLKQQWVGVFIYTAAGELLLVNLGGAQGLTRLPASGTRLAGVLESQRGTIQRDDLVPKTTPPP